MSGRIEIQVWLFLLIAMMSGVGTYHMLQITGTIGGVMPAEASEWAPLSKGHR